MENKEFNRFNDGKVDPSGRIWVGSMASDCKGTEGFFYCIHKDKSWTLERENVGISNGLAWTKDKKIMYYIDSTPKKVFAFDYEDSTGKISNERVAFEWKEENSTVDGMTIDSVGFLWIAIWGGEKVIRVNPANGEVVMNVKVPGARNITSCCFGGPDLTTLYITSASCDTDITAYPNAGCLFRYEAGVSGLPVNKFQI